MDGLRLGVHLPLGTGGILSTLQYGVSIGCPCVQVFNPNIVKGEKARIAQHCHQHDQTFYVHAPLNTNFGSLTPGVAAKTIQVVQRHLDEIAGLPAAVITHIGRVGSLEQIASNLDQLRPPPSHDERISRTILIENGAGQGKGSEKGSTWDELRLLSEALDTTHRFGLCADTQHLFASGMCSFQTAEGVDRLFEGIRDLFPSGIGLVHLNDSKCPCHGKIDRHESLCKGHIWCREVEGLQALLHRSSEHGIDLVLETPDPESDVAIARSMMEKDL